MSRIYKSLPPKGTLDFMTVRTETVNQRGERVLVARWTAVIRG